MAIGDNIRRLRIGEGLTQRELAEGVGVSTSTVTQWELGMSLPRMKRIDAIAKTLGVASREVLENPRETVIRDLPPMATVPLVAFGGGSDGRMGACVEVPVSVRASHPSTWACLVTDDTMDRVLPVGMVVVCDPDQEPTNGNIAIVSVNGGEFLMRRWYHGESTVMLAADSHASHEDIVVGMDDSLTVLGTVVWTQAAEPLA